jgi:N-acetylmuramoyl-L-alanine amidase
MNTLTNFINHLEAQNIIDEPTAQIAAQEIECFMNEKDNDFCVFLDAGHGGIDPKTKVYTTFNRKCFKHSHGKFHRGGWFYEGVWNRTLTNKVASRLKDLGVNYKIVSHEYKDTRLRERVKKANELSKMYKKSLYVSNHSNTYNGKVRGFEIYTSPGSTTSDRVAQYLWDRTKELFGDTIRFRPDMSDGDIDKEERFFVLTKTIMPAMLIEHLYFDNYDDAFLLMQKETVNNFAAAQVETILAYRDGVLK